MYEDGSLGEVFILMHKEGSILSGLLDAFGIVTSIALQYGAPLEVLVDKMTHMRFEPAGMTKNKQIPIAKSLVDYLFRWLATEFMDEEKQQSLGIKNIVKLESATEAIEQLSKSQPKSTGKAAGAGGSSSGKTGFDLFGDAPSCDNCGVLMERRGAATRVPRAGTRQAVVKRIYRNIYFYEKEERS